MRGEFLETALYWARVVFVRLGAIAEKKVCQHFCVQVSVCVQQPVHQWFHTAVRAYINKFVHMTLLYEVTISRCKSLELHIVLVCNIHKIAMTSNSLQQFLCTTRKYVDI